jgi:plastocyanin
LVGRGFLTFCRAGQRVDAGSATGGWIDGTREKPGPAKTASAHCPLSGICLPERRPFAGIAETAVRLGVGTGIKFHQTIGIRNRGWPLSPYDPAEPWIRRPANRLFCMFLRETRMYRIAMIAGLLAISASSCPAEDWGTVSGQFVFSGDIPKPELLHAKGANIKDAAVCAAADVFKEDLVIDPDSKGVANIFVYLLKAPKSIHPDLKNAEPKQLTLDQKGCVFMPHAMTVTTGQVVEVLNSDTVAHNTHTNPVKNSAMNVVIAASTGAGKGEKVKYSLSESVPTKVNCDFHPWMMCYWMVLDHPYSTVTDKDGKFTIPNLPVGEHKFRVWQERVGYINREYTITVRKGDNPQPVVELTLEKLTPKK